MVLPVFVLVVLFFALLIAYPWWVLSIGTVAYLVSLPFGWLSYQDHRRKDTEAASTAAPPQAQEEPAPVPPLHTPDDAERPTRLN